MCGAASLPRGDLGDGPILQKLLGQLVIALHEEFRRLAAVIQDRDAIALHGPSPADLDVPDAELAESVEDVLLDELFCGLKFVPGHCRDRDKLIQVEVSALRLMQPAEQD